MSEETPKRRFLIRRSIPVPTWRGWLVLVFAVAALKITAILAVYPFLSITSPVNGDLLVIEGWVPDHVITQSIVLFHNGPYQLLVTTGVPIRQGYFLSEYKTTADVAAATLRRLGVPDSLVSTVPAREEVERDRTFAAARALKMWIDGSGLAVRGVDVVTVGPHARRSRLVFQRALGDSITVGCVSVPDLEYNGTTWWTTSAGVRDVLQETIGYAYARLFGP